MTFIPDLLLKSWHPNPLSELIELGHYRCLRAKSQLTNVCFLFFFSSESPMLGIPLQVLLKCSGESRLLEKVSVWVLLGL